MSANVRISQRSWKILKEIAGSTNETMQNVLDRAVEMYRRQWILEKTNEAYAALKKDKEKWQEEVDERKEWNATLGDGLGDDG
ncbi:MAG: Uncharacterized protein XD50_0314 [Clostridia bacterium 41_269]|nr:MAG: Uncharacterized protein XD50_0314 [Clostridia bacterium 41_269]